MQKKAQDERLLAFIGHMERWRTLSRRHGVTDLLWDIYESQDYVNYVGAMPNGLVRRAECARLYDRAKGYARPLASVASLDSCALWKACATATKICPAS